MPAIRSIPFAEYKAIRAVNWSALKHMRESALKYKHEIGAPDKDSPARLLGRLTHTLTLEPEKFDAEIAEYTGDGTRASADYKAFARANPGRTIVKTGELADARAMAASVRSHPVASAYLPGATFEQTVTWTDRATQLRCKARPDWLVPGVLVDLKSSNTINELRFQSLAYRLGYPYQLAHYKAGLEACGAEIHKVVMVVVESAPPFDVGVFVLTDRVLDEAADEVSALLAQLRDAQASGVWPGRFQSEAVLDLPSWKTGGVDVEFVNEEEE